MVRAEEPEIADVEGQPLAANVLRLLEALDYVGAPLKAEIAAEIKESAGKRDALRLQRVLDPHVLLVVSINPESRVKVQRGPRQAVLQQAGYTPVLVKVDQPEHGHEAVEDRQSAGGPGLCRRGRAEHEAAAAGGAACQREPSSMRPTGSCTWRCFSRRR